jgi:hypothetical protein
MSIARWRGVSKAKATANCIIIDHVSAFEFELVALFLTLPLKNGWQWVKTARNLNLGVSRNRFCDFLADPDSRSFSRFGAIIMQVAVPCSLSVGAVARRAHQTQNRHKPARPAATLDKIEYMWHCTRHACRHSSSS